MSFDLTFETALNVLHATIKPGHVRYDELEILSMRLRRLVREEQLYGPTRDSTNEQNRISAQLSQLAREVTSLSLSDLNTVSALIDRRDQVARQAPPPVANHDDPPFNSPMPGEEVQLESFITAQSELTGIDLIRAIAEASYGVAKVELRPFARAGTGFLVGANLLLTNYHVLCGSPDEDLQQNAREVRLTFNLVTGNAGTRQFALHPAQAIRAYSHTNELDFVLLQIEDAIRAEPGLRPLNLSATLPPPRSALYLIQHPNGGYMQFAPAANGVIGRQTNYLQYAAITAGGSSGAPCLNADWQVVALHRCERVQGLVTVREGVLMQAIAPRIAPLLNELVA